MIAQSILISDLEKAPAPKPLRAIAQSSIGFPGPQIPIEPRHWYWALMQFPDARISLAPEEERQWQID